MMKIAIIGRKYINSIPDNACMRATLSIHSMQNNLEKGGQTTINKNMGVTRVESWMHKVLNNFEGFDELSSNVYP